MDSNELKIELLKMARDIYVAQGSKFADNPDIAAPDIDKLFKSIHDSVIESFKKEIY